MSDWPDRLEQFIEALRLNRRPERQLARSAEEIDELRIASRLAGARPGAAEPDPAFLSRLREQLGLMPRPARRRLSRLGLLRLAGVWAAGAASALGLQWAWQQATRADRPLAFTPSAAGRWYPVASLAALPVGGMQLSAPAGVPVFVLRDRQSIRVLSRVCTHQGCLLELDAAKTSFYCPCHGAIFDLEGHLVPGYDQQVLPPLPALDTRVAKGIVFVKV